MALKDPMDNLKMFGLSAGAEVADLGAGPGHYALAAARVVGADGHVIAVEIQKKLVKKVETEARDAGLDNVSVVWGDIEKSSGSTLAEEAVDVVFLSNVLFQVKDKSGVLTEAKRILKPGGSVYVVDWSDTHGGLGPQDEHLVSSDEIASLARDAGFSGSESVEVGSHHWGLKLFT